MSNENFSGKIDPEIASLLEEGDPSSDSPNFQELFEEDKAQEENTLIQSVAQNTFSVVTQFQQAPSPLFSDKNFYQNLLSNIGEPAKKFHKSLQHFIKCDNPKEIGFIRQQLVSNYWSFYRSLASTYNNDERNRRYTLRYSIILPSLLSPDQLDMLSRVVFEKPYKEPIHYIDEWLDLVSQGEVNPLASDELKVSQMDSQTKLNTRIKKVKGSKDADLTILSKLVVDRDEREARLVSKVNALQYHDVHRNFSEFKLPYTASQKKDIEQINEIIRELLRLDKELNFSMNRLDETESTLSKLNRQIKNAKPLVDKSTLEKEIDNIRQMHKLCVGRQGNHFPFLMKKFFILSKSDQLGTRENIIQAMSQVEKVDPGVFLRTFRQKVNRIVPHTIIIPCYGDRGICWEPFDRYNKAISPGRIAIPLYPKDLKLAVIFALGDLRWNVAKERAQHYWMEEGLTGHYFQWFSSQKLRGDARGKFLEDYALWINKESQGVQSLPREVRGIFWRYTPFPQELKDSLRNHGFVYNELYKKDLNRSISDGY